MLMLGAHGALMMAVDLAAQLILTALELNIFKINQQLHRKETFHNKYS